MQAVIMAGGVGTRLRPITCSVPKPMASVANRPMLSHIIELLRTKSHLPLLFSEYKREELVNIFAKKGTQAEKEKAYKILFAIDPSQNTQWEKIKK